MTKEQTSDALLPHSLEEIRQTSNPSRDGRLPLTRWGLRALATVIGVAVWALGVALIVLGPKNPGGLIAILLCLPLIGATALALHGWSWFSQYRFGTYGYFVKFLALLLLAMTVVGFVPVCYWTGRTILQKVSENLL